MMRTYVLGAGASYPIYPLGGTLFTAIDEHIQKCGYCVNRFDYQTDWPKLKEWFANNSNPLLRQAYWNGNIEQIFTVLDLAEGLISDSYSSMFRAAKKGVNEVKEAEAHHDSFAAEINGYRDARSKLLWALEDFFLQSNYSDLKEYSSDRWRNLKRFGELLDPGDIVVTFNYDSTIERVLLDSGKWTLSDGYGTDLVFQHSNYDTTPVTFSSSKVKVLHLHGAVGWYAKPVFSPNFDLSVEGGGFIPREALSAAPLETEIALDPLLLQGLGIYNADASLPRRPPDEYQIMLHPSFLKEYGGEDRRNRIFNRLWRMALDSLRNADEVTIIGYSLPPADSAAWTLLHTGCERGRTIVVNPSKADLMNRYSNLLKLSTFAQPMDLGAWLDSKELASSRTAE
jgi:hypothetical protein